MLLTNRTMAHYTLFKLSFLFLLSMPGLLSNIGIASSHALGLALSYVAIFLLSYLTNDLWRFHHREFLKAIIFLFFVLTHFLIVSFFTAGDMAGMINSYLRFLPSFLLLVASFIAASKMERLIYMLEEDQLRRFVSTLYWLLIILAFASVPFHLFDWVPRKQMLIFSEPSHFSILFSSFLFYKVFESRYRYFHIFICVLMGFILQSVTLLAIATTAFMICPNRYGVMKFFLMALCSLTVLTVFSFSGGFFDFLIQRNIFNLETKNLSVLVYLAGLETAYISFLDSLTLGLGFQQMGMNIQPGLFQTRIMELTSGIPMNVFDGGTLASKVVTEFGIFGLVFILWFLVQAVKIFKLTRYPNAYDSCAIFYVSCFLSLSVLLFIRSAGYFTPSTFLFLVGVFGLRRVFQEELKVIKL